MSFGRQIAIGVAACLNAFVLAAAAPSTNPAPPSFDCRQAKASAERAICASPELSALDRRLTAAYQQRLAADPTVRTLERGWLQARNEGCGRHAACLRRFMTHQLTWLEGRAPLHRARPLREGQCSLSTMKDVAYRLEGVADSGTSVEEADGAVQVWYEDVPQAAQSKVGDPALVCLVSIPHGCPKGDARGRNYAVANLRTLGAWSGPDAEHMCGGA